jgi:hypothetical protein
MKKVLATMLLLGAAQAFAHCPDPVTCETKAIDASLATSTAKEETLQKVKELRAEGQKLSEEGREREAVKVLKEARKLLREAS